MSMLLNQLSLSLILCLSLSLSSSCLSLSSLKESLVVLSLARSALFVEQQSEVKRPSVAMPPRRSKIKCLRESVAWLLLFHTVRFQPLLALSLLSLSLPLSQSVARLFAACAKGPQSREASRPACVTRCSSSAVVLVLAMLMLVPSRIWLL